MYSTCADVQGHPLSVADSQGQVAHTRGSRETVAASPSDEEQMATSIIFLHSAPVRAVESLEMLRREARGFVLVSYFKILLN